MPKQSRKRQKLSDEPNPLLDDSAKDDEERRLESLLFGTKYVPSGPIEHSEDNEDELVGEEGRQFQNLLDNDVRIIFSDNLSTGLLLV